MAGRGNPKLKQVFQVVDLKDMFGANSKCGLTWTDYNNIEPFVGRILAGECHRYFPLECQDIPPIPMFPNGHPTLQVLRCGGRKVDAGVPWRTNNLHFPGHITLRLRQPGDDFLKWDVTAPRESHHQRWPVVFVHLGLRTMPGRGIHPVCFGCSNRFRGRDRNNGRANFPYNSAAPHLRRWARLCKRHTLVIRQRDDVPPPPAPGYPGCNCHQMVFKDDPYDVDGVRMCLGCVNESTRALQDRADHWRNVLRHTYRRQRRRGTPKPYVDMNKAEKQEPQCPYRNCGRPPWIGTRESEIMGLSVCLACSTVVVS